METIRDKNTKIPLACTNYLVSFPTTTIFGNPIAMHTFNPVHDDKIIEVNKMIDGKIWKYLGYASNVAGSQINLYYTDHLDAPWMHYSQNPILTSHASSCFRWPSTIYENDIFHMFLDNNDARRVEHWTSSDGIKFEFKEIVLFQNERKDGNFNPFVYKNKNDNKWYLYWRDSIEKEIRVNIADSPDGFAAVQSKWVISEIEVYPSFTASPSIIFVNGVYWLLLEGEIDKIWHTFAFCSTHPEKWFMMMGTLLTNNEACAMHYLSPDRESIYLFISRLSSEGWVEDTRKSKII